MNATPVPTVFISAASIDLKPWRDTLAAAFSRAHFRVFAQDYSLSSALGDARRLLVDHIQQSDCVIHLVGLGYGSHAQDPFPEDPAFQCSWTQFEYYFAHAEGRDVIAFVCAPEFSTEGFVEKGDAAEQEQKRRLQEAHRERVEKGTFDGTPLATRVKRTSNERVDSVQALLSAVAAAVGALKDLNKDARLAAQAQLAPPPWHGPQRAKVLFGRQAELVTLRELWDQHHAVAITGTGGMGKTALAAEFLARFGPQPGDAGPFSRRLLMHDYYRQPAHESALAGLISLAGGDPRGLDLRAMETKVAAELNKPDTYLYLEGCEKATDLPALLCLTGSARVLLTTRDETAPHGTHGWALPPLSIVDAAALIAHLSGRGDAPPLAAVTEIAQLLDGHALACRLAGELLKHKSRTATDLLKGLRDRGLASLGGQEKEHESVHYLLRQTAEELEGKNPGTARLWYVLGLGALSPLPLSLLAEFAEVDAAALPDLLEAMQHEGIVHLDEVPPEAGDEPEPAAALAHGLIQTYAMQSLCEDLPEAQRPDTEVAYTSWRQGWDRYLERCFDARQVPGGYRRYETLLPQFDGLLTRLDQREPADSDAPSRLIDLVATLHRLSGRLLAAEPLLRQGLERDERTLGAEHPNTLISLNNLAILLYSKGDLAGVEPLHRRALEVRERTLGAEHTHTLSSLNNLANLLYSKGDLAGAEPLYRRALEAYERTLGAEHPYTLVSLNNLAILLKDKGDLAGAEPLYRRALEARERTLGAEHPDTLMSLNNLGAFHEDLGDWEVAEALYRRAVAGARKLLLPEHPFRQMAERNWARALAGGW